MKRSVLILAVVFTLGLAVSAQADPVFVGSRAGLAGNDHFDWGQFGPTYTIVPNPSTAISVGGVTATVSQAGGPFQRRDQGNGWDGNFAPGDHLLWTQGGGPITVFQFSTPVYAAGAQVQADFFGDFTAQISELDSHGNILFSFTTSGVSTSNGDNSAPFLGISSTTPIAGIEFSVLSATSSPTDFAINQLDISTVPEPSAIVTAALGISMLLGYRWRRRKLA